MTKQVKIEIGMGNQFEVLRIEGGSHWYMAFRGTDKECEVICDAFVKVGYQLVPTGLCM